MNEETGKPQPVGDEIRGDSRDGSAIEDDLRLYAEVFRNAPIGLAVWRLEDPNDPRSFRLVAVNPAASQFAGTPLDQLLGTTMAESFPVIFRTEVPELYTKVVLSGGPRDLGDYQYGDEHVRAGIFMVRTFPLLDNCVGIAFENVTERKRTEEELRKQSHLLDLATDAIMVLDIDRRIRYWNRGAEQMYGWRQEEVLGQDVGILLQTSFPVALEEMRDVLLRTGHWEGELAHVSRTGDRITVECHLTLTRDEGGRPAAILEVNRNISARAEAERTIRSLLGMSGKLNSTLDVEVLMDSLVLETLNLMEVEGGYGGLREPEGMVCRKYFRGGEAVPLTYCWPPGQGLPGWLILHKVPYMTNDAAADPQIVLELRATFGVRSAISMPILDVGGEVIGFLEVHNKKNGLPFTEADRRKLIAVSNIASSAVQNALAFRNIERAEERLHHLSSRLLEAREVEARRIARDLHDIAGQLLASVHFSLEELAEVLPSDAQDLLQAVRAKLHQAGDHLRRISHELRSPILDDLGLEPALDHLAKGIAARTNLEVIIEGSIGKRLTPTLEMVLYRSVQEALTNVARHASANRVSIELRRQAGRVQCMVRDDGLGFDVTAMREGQSTAGIGLLSIEEWLAEIGGQLSITSAPGRGTELTMSVPVKGEDEPSAADRSGPHHLA